MRVITKIGDIFYVMLENGNKVFFQYIANDLTQLNSDVIRVFKKEYLMTEKPDYDEVLSGEIDFHAHTMINIGVKLKLFHQSGKHKVIPDIKNILFRGSRDYGVKTGDKPIKISNNWYTWRINDEKFTDVGKLDGENKNAELGPVIPPYIIVERIQTGKFNFSYQGYE